MKLYHYYRSSASYRVRIALALKGLEFERVHVDLAKAGGEQLLEPYRSLNPQSLVPCIEQDGQILTQSLAVVEFLEERYPQSPLLPEDPWERARVRAFALSIACDIQPIANLRVQKFLREHLGLDQGHVQSWLSHWISSGLKNMEKVLEQGADGDSTGFCFGDTPSLADVVLVPQMYNAHRFNVETMPFKRLESIYENCLQHPAFQAASPEKQPEAKGSRK